MGKIYGFCDEKLIIGVLYTSNERLRRAERLLVSKYGEIDVKSEEYEFNFTNYYNGEMGERIIRVFYSFKKLINPSKLPDAKVHCNKLEEKFLSNGNRNVNLDPGVMNLSRLLLASTKNNAHRVPLSKGIYAEVTLLFKKSGFQALPWTYPDFSSGVYFPFFSEIRKKYKVQLKRDKK